MPGCATGYIYLENFAASDDSSERDFYFYYTDTPGECPEFFLISFVLKR